MSDDTLLSNGRLWTLYHNLETLEAVADIAAMELLSDLHKKLRTLQGKIVAAYTKGWEADTSHPPQDHGLGANEVQQILGETYLALGDAKAKAALKHLMESIGLMPSAPSSDTVNREIS